MKISIIAFQRKAFRVVKMAVIRVVFIFNPENELRLHHVLLN